MSIQKDKKTRACILPTCAGERFDLVHKFPMENKRVEDWLNALELPDLYSVPLTKLRSSYFVCTRHFRNEDYKNIVSRHLNKTAIPCINLKSLDKLDALVDRASLQPRLLNNQNRIICNASEADSDVELHPMKLMRSNSAKPVEPSTANISPLSSTIDIDAEMQTKLKGRIDINDKISMIFDIKGLNPQQSYCVEKDVEPEDVQMELIEQEELEEEHREFSDTEVSDENIIFEVNADDHNVLESPGEELGEPTLETEEPEMTSSLLEISHPNYGSILSLDNIWLRDHCRCSSCYNTETYQRKLNILEIPLDVKPSEYKVRENLLWIQWNDGHESQYDLDFLFKAQLGVCVTTDDRIFWDQDKVHKLDYGRVNFNSFLTDEDAAKTVVKSLVQFGFAFIEKVPPNPNMTEAAIRRLFPIQKTFFGDMWTFADAKDHSDTAYTKEYLGSHTDNTYFNDAAGLQVLHCIKHTGSGGETFLVDGFKILKDFKLKNPKAYNRLSTINVPAEYLEEGTHYSYTAPIIKIDPISQRPEQIRYNVYDRSVFNTIPQSEMQSFYRDFRALADEINAEINQWRFKLNPGTILIFDNWRVLHGREKYTGKRQISGCYVSRCEFLNTARVMGLIS